jgi:glutamate/tyrosine decarboxylase-like PLP-dependent enzyme
VDGDRRDELWLDAERMRELGYRTVDMLVEHLSAIRSDELVRAASREELEQRLHEPPPEEGSDFGPLLDRIREDVLPFIARQEHPGYMAYIPSSLTWPGALGDFIGAAVNLDVGSWLYAAGPTQLELTVLDWFRQWVGFPDDADGLLVSGGSAANMTALACARETLIGSMSPELVTYCSQQSHSSTARAARALGFRPDQLRVIPTDDRHRMRVDQLRSAIDVDRRAGREPFFVSANAGSTSTGAVDPLGDLAELCRGEGLWLHVDGAYGAFAALTDRGRAELAGIEQADSLTLDPHKWFFQPIECAALLVRHGGLLQRAFEVEPEYLDELHARPREVNLSDWGLQLTRAGRAVKIWLSVRYFGLGAFRRTIDRALDLAEHAQRRIEASAELELMNPRSLGIVCFRRRFGGETDEVKLAAWNARLVEELARTGRAMLSSTRLDGRFALRMVVMGHATMQEDVDWVLDWLESAEVDRSVPAVAREAGGDRTESVEHSWLERERPSDDDVLSLPLFANLDDRRLDELRRQAWTEGVETGETIVSKWDQTRDFYVVQRGSVEVRIDGEVVATLGAGNFFGEIAALDWVAQFAHSRIATVSAVEPTRLVVVPPGVLNRIARSDPAIAEQLRAAMRIRMGASQGH